MSETTNETITQVEEIVTAPIIEVKTTNTMVQYVVCNCSRLYLRKKPSQSSDVVITLSAGDIVYMNESKSDPVWGFVKVKVGELYGYCMRSYLKK